MIDWNKIKEDVMSVGAAIKTTVDDFTKEIKEESKPKTMEEKVADLQQFIAENPELTHEQIKDLVNGLTEKSDAEKTCDELKEKLRWGFSEFKKAASDIISKDDIEKFRTKVDSILESDQVKDIRETIDLQNRLKKAVATGQAIGKVITEKVHEAIEEVSKKGEDKPETPKNEAPEEE